MGGRAFFGKPAASFVEGGAHVTLYLVPVYSNSLVVFDVHVPQARGRWLPWDVLDFGGNPYETASRLADDWCQGNVRDLTLVDVMSFAVPGGGWELAIVFRAELTELPVADEARTPVACEPGHVDAIGSFDPVDLERWVGAKARPSGPEETAPVPALPAAPGGLLF